MVHVYFSLTSTKSPLSNICITHWKFFDVEFNVLNCEYYQRSGNKYILCFGTFNQFKMSKYWQINFKSSIGFWLNRVSLVIDIVYFKKKYLKHFITTKRQPV